MALPFKKIAFGLVGTVAIGMGAVWWLNHGVESTDDAFIESDVVSIAPRVGGTVAKVAVKDNQEVKAGDLLFELDPTDFALKVDEMSAALLATEARSEAAQHDRGLIEANSAAIVMQAEAALNTARQQRLRAQAEARGLEADALLAERDVQRFKTLRDKDEISQQRYDQVLATRDSVKARWEASLQAVLAGESAVHQAEGKLQEAKTAPRQVAVKAAQAEGVAADVKTLSATLGEAKQALSYTRVEAPADGRVTKKTVLPGQVVQANQALLSLVTGAPWVIANFKETQLRDMKLGQAVDIRVDAYPDAHFKGHVESLQAGTGSRFSLLPPENATGNYVKVVQRIPVKIVFDEPLDRLKILAPGMSVIPTVKTLQTSE